MQLVGILVLGLVRSGMKILQLLKKMVTLPLLAVTGDDIGWAGAFVPMIVGTETLRELRNLAGPPPTPGMKMFEVNLESGQAKWKVWKTASYGRRRSRRK